MIILKSEEEIDKIRRASRIVAETLERLKEAVKPGITTLDLDKMAEEIIRRHQAKPACPRLLMKSERALRALSAQNRSVTGLFGLRSLMGGRRKLSKTERILPPSRGTKKTAASRRCYKLLQCNKTPDSRD